MGIFCNPKPIIEKSLFPDGKHIDGRSKQCGGVREPGGSSVCVPVSAQCEQWFQLGWQHSPHGPWEVPQHEDLDRKCILMAWVMSHKLIA